MEGWTDRTDENYIALRHTSSYAGGVGWGGWGGVGGGCVYNHYRQQINHR